MSESSEKTTESSEQTKTEKPARVDPNAPIDAQEERQIADANDLALAVRHHGRGFSKVRVWMEVIFHYFFVGSVSIATIAIAFAIPLTILTALLTLVLTPAFVVYMCIPSKADSFTSLFLWSNRYLLATLIVISVFWSGYFFKHGWPRVQGGLQRLYVRTAPLITWLLRTLNRHGSEAKDETEAASATPSTGQDEDDDDLIVKH